LGRGDEALAIGTEGSGTMTTIRLGNTCLEATRTEAGTIFLHALILVGSDVVHFQRDDNFNWHNFGVIAGNCGAPPSIIATYVKLLDTDEPGSDSGQGPSQVYTGSYATVVQGTNAVNYFRASLTAPFAVDDAPFSRNALQATLVSFGYLQTNASAALDLEGSCLVLEGNNLVHYYTVPTFTNNRFVSNWVRGDVISTQATGAAGCTKSAFRPGADGHYNQEAMVLEGRNMVHYWMNGSTRKWARSVVVSSQATAPASITVSGYRNDVHAPGNLEVLIPEGNNLVHYWRDNSASGFPWKRSVVVSSNSSGAASFLLGGYGDPHKPNFEALVQENNTVFHYWRDNTSDSPTWKRDVPIVSG
jgi:hypothetical protein